MTDQLKNMFDNLDIIRDEITKQWHLYNNKIGPMDKFPILGRLNRIQKVKKWYKQRIIKEINKL